MNVTEVVKEITRISPAAGREADKLLAEINHLTETVAALRETRADYEGLIEANESPLRRVQVWVLGHMHRALGNQTPIKEIDDNEDFTERFTVLISRVQDNRERLDKWRTGHNLVAEETKWRLAQYLWLLFEKELPDNTDARDLWERATNRVRELLPSNWAGAKAEIKAANERMSAAAEANYELHAMELHQALGRPVSGHPHEAYGSWREWWDDLLEMVRERSGERLGRRTQAIAEELSASLGGSRTRPDAYSSDMEWLSDLFGAVREIREAQASPPEDKYDREAMQRNLDHVSAALQRTHAALLEMQDLYVDERTGNSKLRRKLRTALADIEFHKWTSQQEAMRLQIVDMALRGQTPVYADCAPYLTLTFDVAVQMRDDLARANDTAERELSARQEVEAKLAETKAKLGEVMGAEEAAGPGETDWKAIDDFLDNPSTGSERVRPERAPDDNPL